MSLLQKNSKLQGFNFVVAVLLSFILFTAGCGKKAEENSDVNISSCTSTNPPMYSNDIETKLQNSCVGCHAQFSTYAGAYSSSSQIAMEVSSGSMPPNGSLSTSDKEAIIQWVACGSKQ